jgi:hypothetical protein
MSGWTQAAISPVALCALAVTPFLASRIALPRLDLAATLATAGLAAILLNTAVPVLLHLVGTPITAPTLCLLHLAVLSTALLLFRRRRVALVPAMPDGAKRLVWIWLGGALLLIPCTPLAGIDTYKWQDLATAVSVERSIPWLVHPAALFGFGPRAYPSAQPLMLATAQTLGGCGVESGYFIVSVMTFTTALASAFCLGRSLLGPRTAVWFAALYVFAPAAMRYLHWATGRGFMLAVLPLFLIGILRIRSAHGLILLVLSALALALSHKAGLVAIAFLAGGLLLAPRLVPALRIALAVVALAVSAVVVAGSGRIGATALVSAGVLAASRFGILLAGIFPATVLRESPVTHPLVSRVTTLLLVLSPLSFTPDMYGALIVLPLAAIAAAAGFDRIAERRLIPHRALAWTVGLLLAVGAVSVVAVRDLKATPRRVREAALHLDALDPSGPLQVHAPRHQGRIQAYLRGCPRFSVGRIHTDAGTRRNFPSLRGPPAETVRGLTAWLRGFLDPSGFTTDWYGPNPRQYYVTIDGEGEQPPDSRPIYDRNGVRIFALGAVPGGP